MTLRGSGPLFVNGKAHAEALREMLNVSQLEIHANGDAETTIVVSKAAGVKCERCWHWEIDVGQAADHPTLCGRCVAAVK